MKTKLFQEVRNLKKNLTFNAENCLKKQEKSKKDEEEARKLMKKKLYENKVDEVKGRIKFVVENSGQHAVIYIVDDKEEELYQSVSDSKDEGLYQSVGDHFMQLGFRVIFTNIDGIEQQVMVITWC